MESVAPNIEWFKALPASLALRLTLIYYARSLLRIPAYFSFAQGAEDFIIRLITAFQVEVSEPGYYVDVGCNLPVTDSNTFDLYLRGWRGLNIDANRDLIQICDKYRKRDINVSAAISDSEREVVFHRSATHLVSTIDENTFAKWKEIWT